MKRTSSALQIGNGNGFGNLNGNKSSILNFTSKEIFNEDKPLNFSIEKSIRNNTKIDNDNTPNKYKNKNIITMKTTEKKLNNTELNNIRFEAEPLENKKKLLKNSSNTNISIEMKNTFNNINNISNNNNNNNELKSSLNNLNNLNNTNLNNNNNFQISELEQFSPVKISNTIKSPVKGNKNIRLYQMLIYIFYFFYFFFIYTHNKISF